MWCFRMSMRRCLVRHIRTDIALSAPSGHVSMRLVKTLGVWLTCLPASIVMPHIPCLALCRT